MGADVQVRGIGRLHETRRAREHAGPGLALVVHAAHHHKRQQAEKLAVLIGHVVAHHARADLRHLRLHAGARLQGLFTSVEGVHASNPTGDLSMGTKPGKASMRASQARMAGYGCSDTRPSGARAT